MPWQKNGRRNYAEEYQKYQGLPAQRKERSERTVTRRKDNEEGITHRGDGLDVDHIVPLSKGGRNVPSNERVVSASANRSFARNPDGSVKSQRSARDRKRGTTWTSSSPRSLRSL